ncbi:MAG: 3-oxoadipate enol-lactonase [Phototrophicales bacterium]|nr:MAG: alpha/beta hydrolase [Phototrophicales bacterium]RMG74199.1 MAG: alpha/beta hydrolase [Chloroflexota bacterium]
MPRIQVNGVELYYEESGSGEETIVFSHGLLMSLHMFDDQIAHFSKKYRCIAYDHRGQGQSEVTPDGYDMETCYEDAAAFIEALGVAPVHFVGLSMGGFVGMRLGARRPDLVKSLVLMETSADPEPSENLPRYRLLQFVARWISPKLIVNGASKSLFGQTFRTDPQYAERFKKWKKHIGNINRTGSMKAASGVFTRKPVYEEIASITTPTLVIVGEEDIATVPAKAERIHQQIAGSKLVRIPKAGHSASVEQPQAIIDAMEAFYASL